jgi:glycosyltransferase involved in cell wall biosynthesis
MRISVLIATRNRRDDLFKTLSAYKKQTYENVEIVIVDNGSDDGTEEMVRTHFPDAVFFRMPDNIVHQALNLGVELSSGDIIWRSDDDSFPESPDAFKTIVGIYNQFNNIDLIATNILNINDDSTQIVNWHPKALSKEETPENGYHSNTFPGGGTAIKREVFKTIGGFWNSFFFEELDFSARATAAGFSIRFFPGFVTLHYNSKGERIRDDRWVSASICRIRFDCRYFPFWTAIYRFFIYSGFHLFMGITMRVSAAAFFECMFGMISMAFFTFRKERNVLPDDVLAKITLGESPWAPIMRHVKDVSARIFQRVFKK